MAENSCWSRPQPSQKCQFVQGRQLLRSTYLQTWSFFLWFWEIFFLIIDCLLLLFLNSSMIYFMMCPHDSGILSYCTCALPPDSSTRTCRENKGYYCSVLSRHWWQGHNMFRCHHTKIRRAVNNRCTFRIISLEIEFLAFMTTSHMSSQPLAPTTPDRIDRVVVYSIVQRVTMKTCMYLGYASFYY